MFYSMYLASVCQRRQWPEPLYEPYRSGHGHYCKVRVNNREYSTDVAYESEALAKDGAAMKAYMICRNFSANDGMFPGQRPGQQSSSGVVQGLPVAIGTGRRSNRSSGASYVTTNSDGTSSGGDSPTSAESGFERHISRAVQQTPRAPSRRTSHREDAYRCLCGRGSVRAYGCCGWCLNEKGWA